MADTQQPRPARTGTTGTDAAAELAEIQRQQQQVIKAALVPVWYWWLWAAPIVAIGAARDSDDPVAIPLAVLVMAVLIIATIPGVRRRVRVHNATIPGARVALAITGLILLVNAVTIVAAASLTANRVPHPLTIGYAAGAAAIVTAGPLLNRYLGSLMLSKARQHINDAPEAGGTA